MSDSFGLVVLSLRQQYNDTDNNDNKGNNNLIIIIIITERHKLHVRACMDMLIINNEYFFTAVIFKDYIFPKNNKPKFNDYNDMLVHVLLSQHIHNRQQRQEDMPDLIVSAYCNITYIK